MISLSRDDLARLFPQATGRVLDDVAAVWNDVLSESGINANVKRLSYFVANIGHESAGMTRFVENLNYTSAASIARVWSARFPSAAAAEPYVRNPQALANKVYADRMGNGPAPSGDGYRYRGRGAIQITGKDNYRRFGTLIGAPLLDNPDLAANPVTGLRIAAAYWTSRGLNAKADRGDFEGVRRGINGGLNGIEDCRNRQRAAERVILAAQDIAPPPVNPRPLAQSRTVQGAGVALAGTAVSLVEPVQTVVRESERGLTSIGTGTWVSVAIGLVVILGALYALYARWDDAGRPLPWRAAEPGPQRDPDPDPPPAEADPPADGGQASR